MDYVASTKEKEKRSNFGILSITMIPNIEMKKLNKQLNKQLMTFLKMSFSV